MKCTIYHCDSCGKLFHHQTPYKLCAFQGNKSDGEFIYCYPCYKELTDKLNAQFEKTRYTFNNLISKINKEDS